MSAFADFDSLAGREKLRIGNPAPDFVTESAMKSGVIAAMRGEAVSFAPQPVFE
ncbi:MAG: hypothetical protein ABSC72_05945 [Methylovirgula sp.]|jgi:hypothetical protein